MTFNAAQARQILLVRAFETEQAAAPSSTDSQGAAGWSSEDANWASAEALRQLGEQAAAEQWLTVRSALASERLVQREPRLAMLLRPGAAGIAWLMALLVGLALLAGLASDAVGPDRRINLLAPPLLAVMAWNLLVYGVLLLQLLHRRGAADGASQEPGGWLQRSARALADKLVGRPASAIGLAPARAFAGAWNHASQPLQLARLATVLHLAALAVAFGALAALYARGLVFEYRASWDSTFLDADTVQRWLHALLAPALAITGSTLPDPQQLEALRFSRGGGENAARWIHWYAITTALVMAPRLLLAGLSMLRSRSLRRRFPLSLDERYFQRLFQWLAHSRDQTTHLAVVAPYGLRAAAARKMLLADAIDAEFGPGLTVELLPDVPISGEDDLAPEWPRPLPGDARVDLLLPLFPLSATPELETHGRFIGLLLERSASINGKPDCRVMVDESGFRERLASADLHTRLQQRRAAWQKLIAASGAGEPLFVDLTAVPEIQAAPTDE